MNKLFFIKISNQISFIFLSKFKIILYARNFSKVIFSVAKKKMLDKTDQIIDNDEKHDKNGVHTRNLYLTYTNSGDNILNGVDLNVPKGEMIIEKKYV